MTPLLTRSVLLTLAVALSLGAACAPAAVAPKLTVHVGAKEMPADGITSAAVTAKLDPPPTAPVVVRFSAKIGALESTVVPVGADGTAKTRFFAPEEGRLGALESAKVDVSAFVLLAEGQQELIAKTKVTVVPPSTGEPTIILSSDAQRVVVGTAPIVVHVVGRRMAPGAVITLTTEITEGSGAVQVPPSVTLGADGAVDVEIPPAAEPVELLLTGSAEGARLFTIPLAFIALDAPIYDLSGTFAQIAYGVVTMEGMGIDPSPQTVAAPTISKVTITQTGEEIVAEFDTCEVQMPIVCIKLPWENEAQPSTTTPGPNFLQATVGEAMRAPIRGNELGALFKPFDEVFETPLVAGAELADPANDPLPEYVDDETEHDSDNDGKPGVTVDNSMIDGEQYIAYRTFARKFEGEIASSDLVDGREPGSMMGDTETNILNLDPLMRAMPQPTITGEPGTFRMVRVDGRTGGLNIANQSGEITCAEIKAYLADPGSVLEKPDVDSCAE